MAGPAMAGDYSALIHLDIWLKRLTVSAYSTAQRLDKVVYIIAS